MKKETGDTVRFEDVAVVRHQQKCWCLFFVFFKITCAFLKICLCAILTKIKNF